MNDSNNAKVFVTFTLSLFLHILHKAKTYSDEPSNDQKSLCNALIRNVRTLLKNWVVHRDVIGGSFFGGSISYGKLRKEDIELKVFVSVCDYEICVYFCMQCSFGKMFSLTNIQSRKCMMS